MRHFTMLLVSVVISVNLSAQFNDSTFYLFRYAATGIINRTNDATAYTIANGLRFGISKKSISLNSNSNWIYGEQQKRLTNNDFSTALDFNLYRTFKHFYYWGLGTYESSYSLKVNHRTQAGLGVAYSLVDREDLFINVSDGILYEFADLKVTDSTNDIYRTFRNSFRFRLRYVFNSRITFETATMLQNALRKDADYIINSNSKISVKIIKWISFTSALQYNKVNRNNRENLLVTFGLTAEKYF